MLHNPQLPDWLTRLDVSGLRVGSREGRLRFERSQQGTATILDAESNLEALVLPR